uniref:Uncharacterized protein n=1 Tax=Arundo donax TaxID=35708 RepID=A0A0A9ACY2_ARUDO
MSQCSKYMLLSFLICCAKKTSVMQCNVDCARYFL